MERIPNDLIENIRKRLSRIDISRFRGVCKSWRSLMPPYKPLKLHIGVDLKLNALMKFIVVESIVFRLVPPSDDPSERGWLVNVVDGQCSDTHKLSPKVHNSVEFLVFEVAKNNTLQYISLPISDLCKVALSLDPDFPAIMLSWKIGRLYYRILDVDTEIGITLSDCLNWDDACFDSFEDVTFYQGNFYIVCYNGTTLVVNSRLKFATIAPPVASWPAHFDPWKKYLVESFGELHLVDRRWSYNRDYRKRLLFKVFRLNANKDRWIQVEARALRDRILVLGEQICYSVAVRDFPGCRGKSIYFYDDDYRRNELGSLAHLVQPCVFHKNYTGCCSFHIVQAPITSFAHPLSFEHYTK